MMPLLLRRGGFAVNTALPPFAGSFVGQTTPTPDTVASVTLAIPAGTIAGDLLCVIICRQPNTQTVTAPGGWTVAVDHDSAAASRRVYVAYKVCGASEPAAAFTFSGSGFTGASLLSYRGATTVTAGTVTSHGATATLTAAGITMPSAGILLAMFYAYAGGSEASLSTPPADMTQRAYVLYGSFVYMPIFDQSVAAGATSTRTAVFNRALSPTLSLLIGLT